MLNEIKEYKQYSIMPDTEWDFGRVRLNYGDMIKNDLTGISRAMTIIARHYIRIENGDIKNPKEVKTKLEEWCGYGDESDNSWIYLYYKYNYFEGKKREFVDRMIKIDKLDEASKLEQLTFEQLLSGYEIDYLGKSEKDILNNIVGSWVKLKKRRSKFGKTIYENSTDMRINNSNEVRFDKIIAEAFAAGPLKRYYLIADKNIFIDGKVIVKTEKGIPKIIKKDSDKDVILKTTAAYLLNRLLVHQRQVVVSKVDIANWCGKSKAEKLDYKRYFYDTDMQSLIYTERIDNYTVMCIIPEWIDRFMIVEEKELEEGLKQAENKFGGAIFFSDHGCEYLSEGVRY